MSLPNRKNDNFNKIQKKDKEKTAKKKVNKFHNGLNILSKIIARDIYNKRIGDASDE